MISSTRQGPEKRQYAMKIQLDKTNVNQMDLWKYEGNSYQTFSRVKLRHKEVLDTKQLWQQSEHEYFVAADIFIQWLVQLHLQKAMYNAGE